jgi:spermidine synthase
VIRETGKRARFLRSPRAFYTLVLFLFFLSGAASLTYQVVWQRLLTLYYGVGPVSVAIIVSVFLAGLGAGAVVGGWLSERFARPLYVYFWVEIAIGLFAIVSVGWLSEILPALAQLPVGYGFVAISLVLLVPTGLMGMTLPLMLKALNDVGRDAGHSLSLLYLANTLGAAVGALVAAYVLISFVGLAGAVYGAAAANLLIALLAWIAMRTRGILQLEQNRPPSQAVDLEGIGFRRPWMAYTAVFATGFLAIGYQIIWFRICSTLLKPSPYVFATVVAIYLTGIALGSYYISRRMKLLHARRNHQDVFGLLNVGIAALTVLTFAALHHGGDLHPLKWMIRTSFGEELHPPYHPVYALSGETWGQYLTSVYLAFDILLWPVLLMLPATILMGASFPLLAAMSIQARRREGFLSGTVYALAILGNVSGGLVTGLVLLPTLGSEASLILFTLAGAFWILAVSRVGRFELSPMARSAAVLTIAVLAVLTMPKSKQLYQAMHPARPGDVLSLTEDVDGVVAVYHQQSQGQDRAVVYIGGSSHATFPHPAYRAEVLEAITYAPAVKEVLVIGFGGGDLTDTLLHTRDVANVTVVEISNALVKTLKSISFYSRILDDRRLRLVIDDGRNYLLRNPAQYDLVMMDPLRSTAAYSNNLYSREFFETIRRRLKPGGVLMLWMNEYEVIPATLAKTFAHLRCYYYFCLASDAEMGAHPERREALWATFTPDMQRAVSARISVPHYYTGDRQKIIERTASKPANTDLNPITEYYLGYNLKRYWGLL